MKKTTKISLVLSVFMMILSVSMLVSTTFAWFTDSASTGVNKIQAGNLDLEFSYWDGTSYQEVTDQVKVFDENALWEPGHMEIAYFKIANKGSLALKYALGLSNLQDYGTTVEVGKKPVPGFPNMMVPVYETIRLSDFLKFAVIPMADANAKFLSREEVKTTLAAHPEYEKAIKSLSKEGMLEAGKEEYVAVMVYMPETVGNEANYKLNSIRFGIQVNATQAVLEADSFGTDYDEITSAAVITNDAEWDIIYRNQEATSAMINVDMARTSVLTTPSRDFDLYIAPGRVISKTSNSGSVIQVSGVNNNVTITGGTVESNGSSTHAIRVDQNGGTTTIKDGHFIGNDGSCIFVSSGTVVIEGGLFECKRPAEDIDGVMRYFVLNIHNGVSTQRAIIVKGGTFVNYNPLAGDNVDKVSFVAAGYKVVEEQQASGDIWYTVVPE